MSSSTSHNKTMQSRDSGGLFKLFLAHSNFWTYFDKTFCECYNYEGANFSYNEVWPQDNWRSH